jgi:pre-mRNA-splicing factor CDC5/CEF1
MVRVFIKGGVWKNSEDEILKAAVMKYGKQQWSRVASLLNRKSAKQCKARWFEWLDPSVKKVEWSREEEEKLLHLAKLMPAQWRSIAPIVGRTAAQCQEHYEHLLDASSTAEGGGDEDEASESADARKLRAGQIDTHPETKPARPDPVDMDEDEVEMLQEARARLANTQGKKAKRKAREKMLGEAKRLADLQKRRELKAAGIISSVAKTKVKRSKKGRREIDYGIEIPFHKPAPSGFHDVSDERADSAEQTANRVSNIDFGKLNEQNMQTRDKEKQEQKKKDDQRLRALEKANMQLVVNQVSKNNDPLAHRARGMLSMPAPLVSDGELAEVAKMSESMKMPPPLAVNMSATDALIGDYNNRPLPTPMRTPMMGAAGAVSHQSIIMEEARNQRVLSTGQTPLLGGESGELRAGTGFDGATPLVGRPSSSIVDGASGSAAVNDTPMTRAASATPMRRDALGLNNGPGGSAYEPPQEFDDTASVSTYASSARNDAKEERRAAKRARLELASALAALPAPQFEYELGVPEQPTEDDDENMMNVEEREVDQAEVEAARRKEIERKEAAEYAARSSVVKRSDILPRPTAIIESNVQITGAEESSVQNEMLKLLQHDAFTFPVKITSIYNNAANGGDKSSNGSKKRKKPSSGDATSASFLKEVVLDEIPANVLEESRRLLSMEGEKESNNESNSEITYIDLMKKSTAGAENMVYNASDKSWIELHGGNKSQRVAHLKADFEVIAEAAALMKKKADKIESKLKIKFGGYEKRRATHASVIKENWEAAKSTKIEEVVYLSLLVAEKAAVPSRLNKLNGEISALAESERIAQEQYRELC